LALSRRPEAGRPHLPPRHVTRLPLTNRDREGLTAADHPLRRARRSLAEQVPAGAGQAPHWAALGKLDLDAILPEMPGVRHCAIDWIRFGQLLRDRLGWHDSPEWLEPPA
jgi:hypothetical protein